MNSLFPALAAFACLTAPLAAFSPVLNLVNPRGGQRGTEVEIHFHGERLQEITGALFYQPGLAVSKLEVKDPKHAVASLRISADAALGEHSLRLHGPGGITELRAFFVGQFPNVAEAEPNASFDQAQRIELNSTVEGLAGTEDEDYYVCHVKKGQRLSIEVEAMRLGRTMFDAYVAILGPDGVELAACDDTPLLRTDCFTSILAPVDGDYRILVREAAYEGSEECQYRLHVGTFPRPTAVFPPGGKPGQTVTFTFTGDPAGPIQQSITLPAIAVERFPIFPVHDGLSAPSPHWVTVSPLETVTETGTNRALKTATPLPPLPAAAHGILDGPDGSDWFKFSAKKGQNLVLRVVARRLRSPLDSLLSIHSADGRSLANNDDQGGPDSMIPWTCPEDGDYFVKIRDQLDRSGPDFTYRIEIAEKSPALAATLPTVERVNTQKWKTFPVPRGNRYAAVINLSRENIACEAVFAAASLPAGVVMRSPPIARGATSFPVVFEAAATAPTGAGLYPFSVRSSGEAPAVTGPLTDTIHHVDVNNQGAYHSVSLDRIATAVTVEAPFKVDLETPAVPLVRNGTLALRIRVARQPGFAEKITLRFLWSPPGVSGPVTVEIPKDQSEALYELNADGEAAAADWHICILAEASTPQGPAAVSSALTPLTVAEPFLTMTLGLAAAEQGRNTPVTANIDIARPFEGRATAELLGLPHGVSCPPQKFTRDQTELTFPLTVAADAKIGKHSGIFCRVTIPQNGGTVLHQSALNSTLRIDAPAATPSGKPAGPAKPLSRLEQLRKRAE